MNLERRKQTSKANSCAGTGVRGPCYMKNISSKEDLCAFYKNKALRLEEKFSQLWDLLDKLNVSCKESARLHSELQARTSELAQLQIAVSDLQVFLFREREENLRLAAENDELRIECYENNRAVNILLKLSGISRSQLADLLSTHSAANEESQENNKPISSQSGASSRSRSASKSINSKSERTENKVPSRDALLLQVKSLKTQLENLGTLFRNEVDVLLKDREVVADERSIEISRFNQQLTTLASNLRKVQQNLQETASRLLLECQEVEREKKISLKDKESLERHLLSTAANRDNASGGISTFRERSCNTKLLQTRIGDLEKLISRYNQQCKHLDNEVKKWKERAEIAENLFSDKSQKLTSELTLMRNRYEELDRRRLLEAEGFRTDIRLLRDRLKELDKKIEKMKQEEAVNASQPQSVDDLKLSTQHALKRAQLFEKEVAALKFKFASLNF